MTHPTGKESAIRFARLAVVSAWDEAVCCSRTSGKLSHAQARQLTTDGRLAFAVRILGGDPSEHDIHGGQGSLEDRLGAWIEEHDTDRGSAS